MSDRYEFSHIDAFAEKAFEGNSAAVYRLETFLDDTVMQRIAREHNLSETAFYVPDDTGEADFVLRWFTPSVEVEMCGHATLASGHHVLSRDAKRGSVRFRTTKGAGILSVAHGEGRYEMNLPAWHTQACEDSELAAALGKTPLEIRVTMKAAEDSFLAVYASEAEIRSLTPDFAAMARIGNVLVVATAPGDRGGGFDVVSRVFAPGAGIDEDPVTGSAHAILTPYWSERLGRPDFTAYQASERGGRVACRLDGDRAILGGTCVDVIEGTLTI